MRGFDKARNLGLSNTTENGAGDFHLPTRPTTRIGVPMSSKPTSMIESQQKEAAYPDNGRLRRQFEKTQSERDTASRDRDPAGLERDLLRHKLEQTWKLQETTATRDQLKSELDQMQRWKQEGENSKEDWTSTMCEK